MKKILLLIAIALVLTLGIFTLTKKTPKLGGDETAIDKNSQDYTDFKAKVFYKDFDGVSDVFDKVVWIETPYGVVGQAVKKGEMLNNKEANEDKLYLSAKQYIADYPKR